jgi:hypothetical protein
MIWKAVWSEDIRKSRNRKGKSGGVIGGNGECLTVCGVTGNASPDRR